MRTVLSVLALVSLNFWLVECTLSPPERSYKILMLLPVSSRSHRNVFLPLAHALVDRGHQVTINVFLSFKLFE